MTHDIAEWRSRSGKHYAILTETILDDGRIFYGYRGVDCGGGLQATSREAALTEMAIFVNNYSFQPDANKTPLIRVN